MQYSAIHSGNVFFTRNVSHYVLVEKISRSIKSQNYWYDFWEQVQFAVIADITVVSKPGQSFTLLYTE